MGWRILTNNTDQWNIFSSISDEVIAEFTSEQELIRYIATKRIYTGKLNAIEEIMTFPAKWTVNDSIQWDENSRKKSSEYYEWRMNISKESGTLEEYHQKIDDKLNELLG